jgi:hypothetical protein
LFVARRALRPKKAFGLWETHRIGDGSDSRTLGQEGAEEHGLPSAPRGRYSVTDRAYHLRGGYVRVFQDISRQKKCERRGEDSLLSQKQGIRHQFCVGGGGDEERRDRDARREFKLQARPRTLTGSEDV